jgi:hypothetical protein
MDTKFDCDQPLEDPRYETFCQLRAKGISQKEAYEQAGFNASESSVHQAASRLAARPEVKSRLRSLQIQAIAGAEGEGDLTPAEIKAKLTMLFRTSSGADVINSLKQLQSEFGILDDVKKEREQMRPDPCAIIAYICTFAGKSGAEIIKELGGREAMESRLSEILRVQVKLGDPAR